MPMPLRRHDARPARKVCCSVFHPAPIFRRHCKLRRVLSRKANSLSRSDAIPESGIFQIRSLPSRKRILSNQPWCSTWGVEVTRGGLVESFHHVAACAMDAEQNVIFAAGDIDSPVFLRSTAKPFIAAAAIAAGVRERFA